MTILLGTVALEPNRWGALDVSGSATIRLSAWLPAIAAAGFDGIEVWDRHLTAAEPDEVDAVLRHPLAIEVLNSYVSLDDDDTAPRRAVAAWAARAQSHGIKFNVGPHVDEQARYGQRIAAWLEDLPASVTLLCECHAGSSIAADPAVAAAVLAAAGSPDRVQAIVHTHEAPDQLRRRFDA